MKNIIKRTIAHPLVSGSIIIFAGTLFANFFNFLFNLFMSRNLTVSDYGTLASLNSLILIPGILAGSIVPTILSFGSGYYANNDIYKLRNFFYKIFKIYFLLGFSLFLISLLFSKAISSFFNISDSLLIILAGLLAFIGFLDVVNRSLIQAKLEFFFLAAINILGASLKLVCGLIFVFLGFAVRGAFSSILISSVLPYLLTFISLKPLFQKNVKQPLKKIESHDTTALASYAFPSAFASLGLTSFITTDIILTKHFFDPERAGIYAGLSLVGRVIYFFSSPISTVMFPLIVQKHTKKENFHNTFKLSLGLIVLFSLFISLIYIVFPDAVIKFFLKNDEYRFAAQYIGIYAIFMSVYSVLAAFTNFYLSIKRTIVFIPIIIASILQFAFIWMYHETYFHVIIISVITVSLLLLVFLLYYWKIHDDEK